MGGHDSSPRRDRPDELLARRGGAIELLRVPALLMRGVVRLRNSLYDRGILPSRRLELPVISVGNLVVGGTGKTPMVIWLARELVRRGLRPGVLSRGYRARHDELNDEGQLLDSLLPGIPQVQRADRVAGALALGARGVNVILLDDGFQHRRLARDVDLVLIDATRPWGLPPAAPGEEAVRSVLPRGFLREELGSLGRASALVITRSDLVDGDELAALEAELEEHVPGLPRLLATHRPVRLRQDAETLPLEALRGRAVQLVSGIGNPAAFERTVRGLGAEVRGVHAFPDHHHFRAEDLEGPRAAGGELLVTAKDSVKLAALDVQHLVLDVELEITRGERVLEALLDSLPGSQRSVEQAALHEGLYG